MRTRKGKEQCDLCGREEEEDNIVWYSGERFNLCKSHYRAWLRNQKQNWIENWCIGSGIVIFSVMFIILGIIYINPTHYICSKNPERYKNQCLKCSSPEDKGCFEHPACYERNPDWVDYDCKIENVKTICRKR